jgi:hypothetical protein
LPTRQLKEMIYREAVDFKISQLTETSLWIWKSSCFAVGSKFIRNILCNGEL